MNETPTTNTEEERVGLKWVWFHGRKFRAPRGYRINVRKSLQRRYLQPQPMANKDRLMNYVKQNGTTLLTPKQERRLRKAKRRSYGH